MALLAKEAEGELGLTVITCPECGALVLADAVEIHGRWHGITEHPRFWKESDPQADRIAQLERELSDARSANMDSYDRATQPHDDPFNPTPLKCACGPYRLVHVWTPGESCPPVRIIPEGTAHDTQERGQ